MYILRETYRTKPLYKALKTVPFSANIKQIRWENRIQSDVNPVLVGICMVTFFLIKRERELWACQNMVSFQQQTLYYLDKN